jgi:hypothetical protein
MKVKIGDKIYDASEEPIMLILTQEDRKNIENMAPDATKYCAFPDNTSLKFVKEFMKIEN